MITADIGIEQKQVAATHLNSPDFCRNRAASRFDLDHHGLAVGANRGLHRRLIDVCFQVVFLLPAARAEVLAEISLAIEKADTDEWYPQIGCALDVISRKDAKATRVNRHRLMQ